MSLEVNTAPPAGPHYVYVRIIFQPQYDTSLGFRGSLGFSVVVKYHHLHQRHLRWPRAKAQSFITGIYVDDANFWAL